MAFWTYILRCADGSYYTGHTDDLDRRIAQHSDGTFPGYTHSRRPVEVAWVDKFQTRHEALQNELRIKGWSRAKKEALIAADWDRLSIYAMPPSERAARLRARGATGPSTSLGTNGGSLVAAVERQCSPPPIFVLVRPQLGENIGKAARAMLNFGLAEMRLVAPRDGWPNPSAGPSASGADTVLEHASVHETLSDAVADCAHVYATTVRKRGVTKPVLNPEQAATAIHANTGRSAIVFGPERSGLETEDVALARAIITVPVNPAFASLNLAQAVVLCAYEWSKLVPEGDELLAQPTVEEILPPAPQAELDGLIGQFEALLEPFGYFRPPSRAAATRLTLRNMLTKPGWNHLEVRTMRGVLSALKRRPEGEQ